MYPTTSEQEPAKPEAEPEHELEHPVDLEAFGQDPISPDAISPAAMGADPISPAAMGADPISPDPISRDPIRRAAMGRDPIGRDPADRALVRQRRRPMVEPARAVQRERAPWLTAGGLWNAFKTFAILFSFIVNFVLVIALILVALQVPVIYGPIKAGLLGPLVAGLYQGFGDMNNATITRTIEVRDTVPARFTLSLDQTTTVEIVEPVPLSIPAAFSLGPFGQINGTVSLALPAGTKLPVHLALSVPVSETIPINLKVAVSIPLDETELGPKFQEFQTLFAPLDEIVSGLPDEWDALVACALRGDLPTLKCQ